MGRPRPETLRLKSLQILLPHQTPNLESPDFYVLILQLGNDPPRAVSLAMIIENFLHLACQFLFLRTFPVIRAFNTPNDLLAAHGTSTAPGNSPFPD